MWKDSEHLIITPWPHCFYSMTWGFRCCILWKEKQFGVGIELGWYYGQSLWNPAVERHCREMNQNWVQRASEGGFCSHQGPVNSSWWGRVQESRDGAMGCAFLKGGAVFPEMSFSKPSKSPVETAPCSLLPMELLWCHSGAFSLGTAQKAVNSFFSPLFKNCRTCWCWENRVDSFCLLLNSYHHPFFFSAVWYSRQWNRASS